MTKSKSKAKTKKPRSKYGGNPVLNAAGELGDQAVKVFKRHRLTAEQGLIALGMVAQGLMGAIAIAKREAQQTSHTE